MCYPLGPLPDDGAGSNWKLLRVCYAGRHIAWDGKMNYDYLTSERGMGTVERKKESSRELTKWRQLSLLNYPSSLLEIRQC